MKAIKREVKGRDKKFNLMQQRKEERKRRLFIKYLSFQALA